MPHNEAPLATLSIVAQFPADYFLENLIVREDNSLIVTVLNNHQLWYVPAQQGDEEVTPVHLFTFPWNATGIVEREPDVLVVMCSDFYGHKEAFIYEIDLRQWKAGQPVTPRQIYKFPSQAKGLNGCCMLAPGVLLVADSFAGLIWRVDLPQQGEPKARIWLEDESMGYFAGKMKPEQPGVNGIRYSERMQTLYYSATAKKLLMGVKVDPATLEPAGRPELIVAGRMGDDFCIDDDAQVMYLTTHRQNTLDVVSLDPGIDSGFTQSVAGDPFNELLIGPSSAVWRRGPQDYGRVLYMTSDGGTASPEASGRETAKLLRVELKPLNAGFPGYTPPK